MTPVPRSRAFTGLGMVVPEKVVVPKLLKRGDKYPEAVALEAAGTLFLKMINLAKCWISILCTICLRQRLRLQEQNGPTNRAATSK